MNRLLLFSAFLLPPMAWCGDKEDLVRKDLKLMQGKWTMVALEVNGKEVPAARIEGTVLTIKDDVYQIAVKGKKQAPTRMVLDPKQDPKHMDMIFLEGDKKDDAHKAIYRIDGDKLQVARGLNADQARPNQFATWPDTNYFVVTWKRQPD